MDALAQKRVDVTQRAKWPFIIITLFALGYNAFLPLHPDEAYYWTWSRHLALSYFDAPPMTAYLIWLSTHLFGTSVFSIKLVSVLCLTAAAWLSHQFCLHHFDAKVAETNLILILLLPLIQAGYLLTTPDSPLILFWVATLYSFYHAIHTGKNRYFYLAGICGGLMLLSKYTGILLPIACFGYLLSHPDTRHHLRNPHLYLAALLAACLFSPVIIWNMQHHWVSFAFQWHHGTGTHFSWDLLGQFLGGQLGVANPILFIALWLIILRHGRMLWQQPVLRLCLWGFVFPFTFFLYQACCKKAEPNWPAPAYVCGMILLAYWITRERLRKTYIAAISISILAIVIVKFPWTAPFLPNKNVLLRQFLGYAPLVSQATPQITAYHIILSDSYQNASEIAFYLPDRPQVYIITPGRESQYTIWSRTIRKNLPAAWYIGDANRLDDLHQMMQCTPAKPLSYQGQFINREWVITQCRSRKVTK